MRAEPPTDPEPTAPLPADDPEPTRPLAADEPEPTVQLPADDPEPTRPLSADDPEPTARLGADEPDHHAETKQRVAPLELFFDLVFVFAFTQVTAYMAEHHTWEGLGEGVLILWAIWWAWAAYAWLTNFLDPNEIRARLAIFASMAAMLVAALAIPGAFGDDGVLFGVAYFIVRALHILVFAWSSDDVDVAGAVRQLAWTALAAPALIIAAGFLDGGAQVSLWIVALALDNAGPYINGVDGFRVSPAHFAERFALIIIIALGESIVAVGIGAEGIELGVTEVVAAVAAVGISGALWWAYFDVVAIVAERRFVRARPPERNRIARDSYSYLHLPLIAGIVLLALGIKLTIGHTEEPLDARDAFALCGGVGIYLLGHVAFRWRNVHTLNKQRLLAALIFFALIPYANTVDAVVALVTVAVVGITLAVYEAVRFRDARERIIHGGDPSDVAEATT